MASYSETLDRIYHLRGGIIDLRLDRVAGALELFGHPERKFPSIHIAGTNGKGSTSAMLQRVLSLAGYRTALYTSPHLVSFTERIKIGDEEIKGDIGFYEVLEPSSASVMARFTNIDGTPPAITVNRFGKGRAIYVATPAQPQFMRPLYRSLYASMAIEVGPKTPEGVYARAVEGRVLYVNTTNEPRDVAIEGTRSGVLTGKRWTNTLRLPAFGVDLLE